MSQPGQKSHKIPAKANENAKQIKALRQELAQAKTQLAKTNSVASATKAKVPTGLAALINSASVTYIESGATIPASAHVGDILILNNSTAPTPYICTVAYSSGGSLGANWEQPTDATTIALCFSNASAATAAFAAAGGKSTVYFSTSAATSSGVTPSNGDTWWQHDGSNNVIAQWVGAGGSWQPSQVTSAMIANLTAGLIQAAIVGVSISLSAPVITAGTITGATVESSSGTNRIVLNASSDQLQFYYSSSLTGSLSSTAAGWISCNAGLIAPTIQASTISNPVGQVSLGGVSTGGTGVGSGVLLADLSSSTTGITTSSYPLTPLITTSGQVNANTSTRMVKTDVTSLLDRYPRAVLRQIETVLFRWWGSQLAPDGTPGAGAIADQVHALGLRELVIYGADGMPAGIHYDRMSVFALALAQAVADDRDALAETVSEMQASFAEMKAQLAQLTSGQEAA